MADGTARVVGRNSVDDVVARAPDFVLYGLDEPWAGPGWVAGMSGPVHLLATFSLGHLLADRTQGVTVKTAARDRYDQVRSADHQDPVDAVAAEAVNDLIAATWPDPEIMRQADWLDDVYSHGSQSAREHRSWARVSWSVDGAAVDAGCWHFAGGWTGFTTALPDVYVVVTAVGVDPAAIRLRRLTDAAPYGFELGADVTVGQMAIGAPLPNPNRGGFHADHHAARRPTRDPS